MLRRGKKSLRGQAEIYDEVKVPTSLALTPMGRKLLDAIAASWSLSRSELIERIARGDIQLKGEHES